MYLCISRGLGHIVLFPFCYCLNTGGREPRAASHEPITQQRRQHALCAYNISLDSSGSLRICKNYKPGLEGWFMLRIFIFPWYLCIGKHSQVWMEDQCMPTYMYMFVSHRMTDWRQHPAPSDMDKCTARGSSYSEETEFKWMRKTQGIGEEVCDINLL